MKNGIIVWFCLRVMVHKMSQMIHFANVFAEINKKYTHFIVIRLVNLKDLIILFQKMVWIMGISAKAQEISSPTDEVISCIFAGSLFSWNFDPLYLIYSSIVYFVSILRPIWYQHQGKERDLKGVVV